MMRAVAAATTCVILAACGGNDQEVATGETETGTVGAPITTAAADPSAAPPATPQATVDCRQVRGQTAPQGQPADDILGLRQGMTIEQVRNVLTCANPNFAFEEQVDTSVPSDFPASRRVTLVADAGLDEVHAEFVGGEGEERLIRVAREVEYAAGSEPVLPVVTTALQEKYGEFEETQDDTRRLRGVQVHAPGGQRIGPENNDFSGCASNVGMRLNANYDIGNCGQVVVYEIRKKDGNRDLAQSFTVVSMNQTAARRIAEAATAAETARAEAMAAEAQKAGDGPAL